MTAAVRSSAPSGAGLHAEVVVERRGFSVRARLAVPPSGRLALVGPSGAGKSTLLEALAGLVPLAEGHVALDGELLATARPGGGGIARLLLRGRPGGGRRRRPLPPPERRVALVRQGAPLFPHLSVAENLAYGASRGPGHRGGGRRRGRGGDADVEALLGRLGLAGLGPSSPATLSGGQRQRVALGRVLARPFSALLVDEPFAGLDATARAEVRDLLLEVAAERGALVVLVTHDLPDAQALGGDLAVLDAGRVLRSGPVAEVVAQPATRRVAELLGYTGFLPAPHAGGGRWVAVHPDSWRLGPRPTAALELAARVLDLRPHGRRFACELRPIDRHPGAPERLVVHLDEPVAPGTDVVLSALDAPLVAGGDGGGHGGGEAAPSPARPGTGSEPSLPARGAT